MEKGLYRENQFVLTGHNELCQLYKNRYLISTNGEPFKATATSNGAQRNGKTCKTRRECKLQQWVFELYCKGYLQNIIVTIVQSMTLICLVQGIPFQEQKQLYDIN